MTNPFKNYKQALKFIYFEIDKKFVFSNYKPTDMDWAVFTLLKSPTFIKRIRDVEAGK